MTSSLRTSINLLFEDAIAQCLVAAGYPLFFYTRYSEEKHRNDIEIDFLVSNKGKINPKLFPVEVKSGVRYATKSLDRFGGLHRKRIGEEHVIHAKGLSSQAGRLYLPAYMAFCFCCPCCCTALNLCKTTTRDIRDCFTPSGFTATVDHEKCIGCYKCMETTCPQDALQVRATDGKVVVNQETCFGCGYCKPACPTGTIHVRQTMPMRENMHEYFLKETRLDLAVDGFPGAGAEAW